MDNALKKTVTGLIKLNTAKLEKNEAGKAEKPQESDIKQQETSEGFEDTLVDFVYPMVEDQIIVGERSWEPADESHEAFKSLIIEAFANKKFKTLTHICHNVALKCVEWFGTPGGNNYTVMICILRIRDYVHHGRLNEVWGSYAEYQISRDFLLVFKDGIREGQEQIE